MGVRILIQRTHVSRYGLRRVSSRLKDIGWDYVVILKSGSHELMRSKPLMSISGARRMARKICLLTEGRVPVVEDF